MEIRNQLGLKTMIPYSDQLNEVILDSQGALWIRGRDLELLTLEQLSKVKLEELTKGLNREIKDKMK